MNRFLLNRTLGLALFIIAGAGCKSEKPPSVEVCPENSQEIAQLNAEFVQAIDQCDTTLAAEKIRAIARECPRYDTDPLNREIQAVKCNPKLPQTQQSTPPEPATEPAPTVVAPPKPGGDDPPSPPAPLPRDDWSTDEDGAVRGAPNLVGEPKAARIPPDQYIKNKKAKN